MEDVINQNIKTTLYQRITNPFFVTFFTWWLILNFDFILIITGNTETLEFLRNYYGYTQCSNAKFSSFLCFCPWIDSKLNYVFYYLCYDILFPVVMTFAAIYLLPILTTPIYKKNAKEVAKLKSIKIGYENRHPLYYMDLIMKEKSIDDFIEFYSEYLKFAVTEHSDNFTQEFKDKINEKLSNPSFCELLKIYNLGVVKKIQYNMNGNIVQCDSIRLDTNVCNELYKEYKLRKPDLKDDKYKSDRSTYDSRQEFGEFSTQFNPFSLSIYQEVLTDIEIKAPSFNFDNGKNWVFTYTGIDITPDYSDAIKERLKQLAEKGLSKGSRLPVRLRIDFATDNDGRKINKTERYTILEITGELKKPIENASLF